MKKILYIITKSNWGGAQRHVFDLATEFKKLNNEVYVAGGGKGTLAEKLSENHIHYTEIRHFKRDINPLREIFSFFEVYKLIKKAAPDILHLHSPKSGGIGGVAGALYNFLHSKKGERKIKIIYTIHGFSFNEARGTAQKMLIKFCTWITLLLSDKVVTLSEREKNMVSSWPYISSKLSVIPNCISEIPFKTKEEAREALFAKIGITSIENKTLFGTIAELHKNKNLPFAIEVLGDIEEGVYFIIGEGEERKKIEEQIKQKSLEKRVFLLGHIENASHFLNAFDYFLLPSKKEGLPYVLLEAGSAGVPIISTDVGGIPELISSPSEGLLIHQGNKKELRAAIDFALLNQKKMVKSALHLKKKILSTFKVDHMVGKVAKLY